MFKGTATRMVSKHKSVSGFGETNHPGPMSLKIYTALALAPTTLAESSGALRVEPDCLMTWHSPLSGRMRILVLERIG
jgi:hypothetical protein